MMSSQLHIIFKRSALLRVRHCHLSSQHIYIHQSVQTPSIF